MRDIQLSRPVLIALIGAVLVGGFLYFKSSSESDVAPPPPTSLQTAATGATGDATHSSGATGASGPTMSAAEVRKQKAADRRKKLVDAAEAAGMPLYVYQPLHQGKTVMIFFWEPSAQDDQHVNQSVKEVKKHRGNRLAVIKEKISNKSRYDGIAEVADITQTPGIVILYRTKADTWQGYIDGRALNSRITRLTGSSG